MLPRPSKVCGETAAHRSFECRLFPEMAAPTLTATAGAYDRASFELPNRSGRNGARLPLSATHRKFRQTPSAPRKPNPKYLENLHTQGKDLPSRSVTANPCLAALEGALYPGSISRPQSSSGTTPLPIRSAPFPPRKGLVERLPRDKLQIEAHPRQEILHSSPRNSDFFSKFGQSYIPTFGHDDFASRIRKPHPSERITAERGIPTVGSSKRRTKVRGL